MASKERWVFFRRIYSQKVIRSRMAGASLASHFDALGDHERAERARALALQAEAFADLAESGREAPVDVEFRLMEIETALEALLHEAEIPGERDYQARFAPEGGWESYFRAHGL